MAVIENEPKLRDKSAAQVIIFYSLEFQSWEDLSWAELKMAVGFPRHGDLVRAGETCECTSSIL